MYTLCHNVVPVPIHAGRLRYHSAWAIVSQLLKDRLNEANAIKQLECFEAEILFEYTKGIIPALEATLGIAQVVREANLSKQEGTEKVVLINFCGHGHFDMAAYEPYLSGKLVDHEVIQQDFFLP